MTENSEISWDQIEKQKQALFQDVIDELSPEEYEIFELVLKLESDNRHQARPRNMKKQTVRIVERVIE